jgi:hypothetical protein
MSKRSWRGAAGSFIYLAARFGAENPGAHVKLQYVTPSASAWTRRRRSKKAWASERFGVTSPLIAVLARCIQP